MTTFEELKDLLVTDFAFDPSTIEMQSSFTDIGLDSLDMAEFMFLIEDTFQVTFAQDQPFVVTVGELVATIDRLRQDAIAEAN